MSTVRKSLKNLPPITEERAQELMSMRDEDIDCSDIPAIDETFFIGAKLLPPPKKAKKLISIRVESSLLESLQAEAERRNIKYQTLINQILLTFATQVNVKNDAEAASAASEAIEEEFLRLYMQSESSQDR